jgi:hypothetical protein
LGSESNTQIGIQTFTVNGDGIASFRVSDSTDLAGFAIDNVAFNPSSSATVKIDSADLVKNEIRVVITGPAKATGSLSLAIKGAHNTFTAKYMNGTAVGPGSYTVNLVRPKMAQDVYPTIDPPVAFLETLYRSEALAGLGLKPVEPRPANLTSGDF